jgi:general secretion pathway protein M
MSPPTPTLSARLGAALAGLSPRERRALTGAAWVLGLGLLWWLALAPALGTLRAAPERHARLDTQLDQMRRLAATAEQLRALDTQQPPARGDALRALEQATAGLGDTGQLSVLGDRATLTLRNTPPAALAQWLAQVRVNARLLPVEARLTQAPGAGQWNGSLVLAGPGLAAAN